MLVGCGDRTLGNYLGGTGWDFFIIDGLVGEGRRGGVTTTVEVGRG